MLISNFEPQEVVSKEVSLEPLHQQHLALSLHHGGHCRERVLYLVRIHFIIVMIRWTGLAPWEFEFPFPGGLCTLRGEP